ncbi:MAG: hypothetical protein ACK5N8_07715 [Alphaproteobacteria bacterium]
MNYTNNAAHIGDDFSIGHFNVLGRDVSIGENVTIGNSCTIYDRTTISNHAFIGSNIVVGMDCRIGKHAEISCGCLIDDGVSVGSYSQLSLGEKVFEDVLPFAQVKDGKIVGANIEAIAENAKEWGIEDVEDMQAEAWKLIEHLATHPRGYKEYAQKQLRRSQTISDGMVIQIICEFALAERNGKGLVKASPL